MGKIMNGLWVVFEGPDGAGKSTTMAGVANELKKQLHDVEIITTAHPGSTQLGKLIRGIIKEPGNHGVTLDPLSTQMLMFVDHINFKNTILQPALQRGAIVLADRCDLISGLVYGSATGLTPLQLNALMSLAYNPRIDMLYIMQCDDEVQVRRLAHRGTTDHFEKDEIRREANATYRKLLTGPAGRTIIVNKIVALDNIKFVDSSQPLDSLCTAIAAEVRGRYIGLLRDG
jgi:dTMP kinase